mgnify:CR=1 FL=1
MPTVLLCVTGMQNADDEQRIERALLAARGVFGAVANREQACVEVDIEDDEVTPKELIAILRSEGFEARLGG